MCPYSETDREKKRDISGHWSGHSEPKRERQKYESRDVRIHAVLIITVIHTYIF